MDPITQGILGATASQVVAAKQNQSTAYKTQIVLITVLGFISGMTADLDVFINSKTDPLLFLEFHRHFTHSLFFIPIGGLLLASLFYVLLSKRRALSFKQIWFYSTAAYATHAVIDACTSYGTQLLWPLTDTRFAWNNMSIIDPLYTLPIIALVVTVLITKKKKYAYIALFWGLFYPQLGVIQRERAETIAAGLADSRGHQTISSLSLKPSLGNLILWKSIYEYDNRFYVDAIRVGWQTKIYTGSSIDKLAEFDQLQKHFAWLDLETQQAKDIERFRWFSQGYVAQNPELPMQIMDMRYSAIPNQIKPLWSIELDQVASSTEHVKYISNTNNRANVWPTFMQMLMGK